MGLFTEHHDHRSGIPLVVVQAIEAACRATGVNAAIGYEGVETLEDGPLWVGAIADRFKQAQYARKRVEGERDAALTRVRELEARVRLLEVNTPTPEQVEAAARQRVMDLFRQHPDVAMTPAEVVSRTGLSTAQAQRACMQLYKRDSLVDDDGRLKLPPRL